jgi:hypothetical protein
MAPLALTNIPNEILPIILSLLHRSHRATLLSIVLVNRKFHDIAASFLFGDVSIVVPTSIVLDSKYLRESISQLSPHILASISHLFIRGAHNLRGTNFSSINGVYHYRRQHNSHAIGHDFSLVEESISNLSHSFKPVKPARCPVGPDEDRT